MNIKEFKQYVELYGADLSRWPVEAVKPALFLMDQSDEAADIFADAGKVDDMLRRADMPVFDTRALAARILAAPREAKQRRIFNPLYVPGVSLMIVAVFGFILGFSDMTDDFSSTTLLADYTEIL